MTSRTIRVARNVEVPYPEPTSEAATKIGRANRRTGTKPEVALRSELHRRRLRFRKDYLVRFDGGKAHVDISFSRPKVAVFVDGCFWHCCPIHGRRPKRNTGYWGPKLRSNVERDERVMRALEADGWRVFRVWEHEDCVAVADLIESTVRR